MSRGMLYFSSINLFNTIEFHRTVLELYLLLTILHADSAYCFAASSPWKFVIFGSTTTKVSMYFSSPGPAGPCLCEGCVSFNERIRRIFGSSVETSCIYTCMHQTDIWGQCVKRCMDIKKFERL